nr:MAG TPA: hypothetical protein [Caudoviricetes sp.]
MKEFFSNRRPYISATATAGSLMPQKSARKTGRLCIKAIQPF